MSSLSLLIPANTSVYNASGKEMVINVGSRVTIPMGESREWTKQMTLTTITVSNIVYGKVGAYPPAVAGGIEIGRQTGSQITLRYRAQDGQSHDVAVSKI